MTFILQSPSGSVYPYSLSMLREEHPNIALSSNPTPQDLEPFNVYPVQLVDQPEVDPRTQIVTEGAPILTGENQWVQTWDVRPATAEEIEQWDAANRPSPNYVEFWDALITSTFYASIRAQSMVSLPMNTLATELIALLGDAKDGRPNENAIQQGLVAILGGGAFTEAMLGELQAALVAGNLQQVYTLSVE